MTGLPWPTFDGRLPIPHGRSGPTRPNPSGFWFLIERGAVVYTLHRRPGPVTQPALHALKLWSEHAVARRQRPSTLVYAEPVSSPRRSPKGMETTDSHLRCHLRPSFGRRQLRQITPSSVLRWQHELEQQLSHSGVVACRSILGRILEAARKERLIATNPVREGGGT
jgi:hypothetical protein